MPASDDPKVRRFVEGLASADQVQQPPGSPGDPQLAALNQYFQTRTTTLGADAIVLDFGSGAGMVAAAMAQVWRNISHTPWYFAVDRADMLDRLALPVIIHNHSRKITVDDLYQSELVGAA